MQSRVSLVAQMRMSTGNANGFTNTPTVMNRYPTPEHRGLHFQCFNRFYDAFREFLQALFIARRTYPIAYDKWIQEQIVEILGLPKLYERLPRLFEIHNFESHEILDKANTLRSLLDKYAPMSV